MSTAIQSVYESFEHSGSYSCVSSETNAIVVVGTGPVGIHFINELRQRNCDRPIVVYGGEPWKPYDRVRLSSYLAGDVSRDELELDALMESEVGFELRLNCAIKSIDRDAKTVTDETGRVQHYAELVLAVGSRPYIPAIDNVHCKGVFTFRSLGEADELFARRIRSRHTVVIGGGLLGLETARAMQNYNTKITVVEHNQWLMMQQLDQRGGGYLKDLVEQKGIYIELGDGVVCILGEGRVEGIKLRSGREIACDTVIIATGIRPNTELARDSGLSYNKGIRINDELQTKDEHIYAIGECAEHNNNVYGLVKPGLEQAAVLADRLSGGDARYLGSLESTRLKVMDHTVVSIGRTGVDEESSVSVKEFVYGSEEAGVYRKIRLFGNRLIGAIAVGDWHEISLLQDAIQRRKRLMFWHLARFRNSGNIWGTEADMSVLSWPSGAVICNCTGVTQGRLTQAISSGCASTACLTEATRAASVCGSCKPLLSEMLGQKSKPEPVRAWRSLLTLSLIAMILAALFALIPPIPYPDSVQVVFRWDQFWRDSVLKQISGFTMLTLVLLGMAVSLRKRITKIKLGDFASWRYLHVVLGVLALAALVVHTGLRLGDELNRLLMLDFIMLAMVGAGASVIISNEHRIAPAIAKRRRRQLTWLHILLFWPLPVLLGVHVVKSYYY
ncbi:MAG: FAD-dependent oxidoreductase [Gammaproteobacteria bacterium]|nr:FAD-dependent oxidoreductase [Gammaproteobacteria bacterium]